MLRKLSPFRPGLARDLWRDRKGSTIVIITALIPTLLGVAGLSVDVGRALAAKKQLDDATQAAALAGAYAMALSGATTTSVTNAISAWTAAHAPSGLTITGTTPSLSCDSTTSGLPSCNGTNPNVVSVTQTANIGTYFLRAIGRTSFALSSTVKAAKAGGLAKPLHVMFVLDSTGSMSSTDSNCTVPGISSPSRFQCALYSIQSVMKVMPTSLDKVGLMIFPGMGTQYSPTSHPCPTQPNSVPYLSTNIKYQIGTALDNTYNNGSGALASASPMVQSVGIYPTASGGLTPCVTNKGGQGSYAAEVITKAQAALPVVTGTQNVIILLSDGDYNASSTQLSGQTAKVSKQCGQAVDAAKAATNAGTVVYAVAYGAPTTGCSTGDTYNPCTAMQAIASDGTKFYTTSTTCKINGSANPVTQLPDIFKQITTTLTKPRLLPH
jgi:Flp pilus assembly protein TadG